LYCISLGGKESEIVLSHQDFRGVEGGRNLGGDIPPGNSQKCHKNPLHFKHYNDFFRTIWWKSGFSGGENGLKSKRCSAWQQTRKINMNAFICSPIISIFVSNS